MTTIRIETDQPISSITINFQDGRVDSRVRITEESTDDGDGIGGVRGIPPVLPGDGPVGGPSSWHEENDNEMSAQIEALRNGGSVESVDLESRQVGNLEDLNLDELVPAAPAAGMRIEIPDTSNREKMVDPAMAGEAL